MPHPNCNPDSNLTPTTSSSHIVQPQVQSAPKLAPDANQGREDRGSAWQRREGFGMAETRGVRRGRGAAKVPIDVYTQIDAQTQIDV